MIDMAFVFALMVLSFIVGVSVCRQTTAYRMGQKMLDDIQRILDHRKVTGDSDITVTATTRWNHEGRDYRIEVEQKPRR